MAVSGGAAASAVPGSAASSSAIATIRMVNDPNRSPRLDTRFPDGPPQACDEWREPKRTCAIPRPRHCASAMGSALEIVPAGLTDAQTVAEIYAHHVLHGTASWETAPPDAGEIAGRMTKVLDAGWPWLLARGEQGDVLGYAYAGQFHGRAGYRYSCED